MQEHGPISVLNLAPTSRFRSNVVGYLREFIETKVPKGGADRLTQQERGEKVGAALSALVDYIAQVPKDDWRLFALSLSSRSVPGTKAWNASQPFIPTVTMRKAFFALGTAGTPAPEDVFHKLVSAGIADVLLSHREHYAELERVAEQAKTELAAAEARAADLELAEARSEQLRSQLAAAEDRAANLEDTARNLEAFLTPGGKKRRVGVENETGLYRTIVDNDLCFEIEFTDDQDDQHWRRLEHEATIEDARRLREELTGQPFDPDPVDNGDGVGEVDGDDAAEASQDAGAGDGDQQTTTEPIGAGRGA